MGGVAKSSGFAKSAVAGFAGGLAAGGVQMLISGLKDGARAFMDFSDTASTIDAKLQLATDRFGNLAQAQKDVRDIAASSRSDIGAVTDLYATFTRQADTLGISQKQVADATSTVGKALKISGADTAASAGAIRQLSQAFASGVLRGDEFNSVNEASPRLMELIADAAGKPVGALRKMAEEGKLTSDVLAKALTDPKLVAGIEKEFGKIPVTFGDVRTAVSNAMVDISGAISKGLGTGSSLGGFLTSIRNATTSLAPVMTALGSAIGGVVSLVASLVKGVFSVFAAFHSGGPGSLTFMEKLTLAFNLIGEAARVVGTLIGEYFSLVSKVISGVVGFISDLWGDLFDWLRGDSAKTGQTIGQSFIGVLRSVKFVALAIPKLFKSAFRAVTGIFSLIGRAISSFFNGNFGAFDGLGSAISAQVGQVGDEIAAVGKQAVAIANDQKQNQATIDRLLGRSQPGSGKTNGGNGAARQPAAAADSGKKSDADKAREKAQQKYADAVARLRAELQGLQVTEEQKTLLDAFENAGLERKIDLTGKQADEIRNLVDQIADAKKLQEVNKVLDDLTAATRELTYSDLQLAQVEARRRAGLNADLAYHDALTDKIDAQAAANHRLAKAQQDAQTAAGIAQGQAQREQDAQLNRDALNDPDSVAYKRQLLDIDRQAAEERKAINALEVVTLAERQSGMEGILQSERDAMLAANERLAAQDKANVLAERQATQTEQLSGFLTNMWQSPREAMKQFFNDLMKKLLAAILKAAILGDKLGGSGGIGGILKSAVMGAIGARAVGGSVRANEPYLVGERGPELFVPGRAGEVLTNRNTRRMGGGSSVNLNPTYNITLSGNRQVDNQTLANIKAQQANQNATIRQEQNKKRWH
ncbi:MAG: hypothetical protein BGP16_00875 [Sphingobium sp. 66-54]|nr:MAG: hypothetical protein BGP16_00875 [Sphingobium sp. 66-54]